MKVKPAGLMVKQADALRKLNPEIRVWVYRNLVKGAFIYSKTS